MKTSIIERLGYTWVALPREGILPLTLLEETSTGIFKRITNGILGISLTANVLEADIFSLFPKPASGAYPTSTEPEKIAFFKGYDILSTKANLQFSGLKGSAETNVKVSQATKRLYNFEDAQILRTKTEILLEEHLNIHKPNTQAVGFLEKLQNGKLYVVVEVLQTMKFSVQDASDFEISGNVTDDLIESYLAKIQASVNIEDKNSQRLAYESDKPITFALKAYKILYKDGKYTLLRKPLRDVRNVQDLDTENLEGDIVEIE